MKDASTTSGGIHFVFEKPQKRVRSQKKRSRLITSCDSCRSKKIKCKPSLHKVNTCETCLSADIPCLYRERDRIRAERGIANFTVPVTQSDQDGTEICEPVPTTTELTVNIRDPPRLPSPPAIRNEAFIQSVFLPTPQPELPFSDDGLYSQNRHNLFDIYRPSYPNFHLMPHFITLFFKFAAGSFAFMDFQETMFLLQTDSLSPLIANCIAAYAVRFLDLVVHIGPRHQSGEAYQNMAKSLLKDTLPTLETIHALIILSIVEYGSGHVEGLWDFGRMAAALGIQLRITTEENIILVPDEPMQHKCRITFWSLVWIDIVSSSAAAYPTLYRLGPFSPNLPVFPAYVTDSIPYNSLYTTLKIIFIIMKELDDIAFSGDPNVFSSTREKGLGMIRRKIANFTERLPDNVIFNLPNLRALAGDDTAAFVFINLHMLFHSVVVVVHCPAMFWTTDLENASSVTSEPPLAELAWTSARNIIDILQTARNVDERFVTGGPQFFMPLFMAHAALMTEKSCLDGRPPQNMTYTLTYTRESNEAYLNNMRSIEACLSQIWKPVISRIRSPRTFTERDTILDGPADSMHMALSVQDVAATGYIAYPEEHTKPDYAILNDECW